MLPVADAPPGNLPKLNVDSVLLRHGGDKENSENTLHVAFDQGSYVVGLLVSNEDTSAWPTIDALRDEFQPLNLEIDATTKINGETYSRRYTWSISLPVGGTAHAGIFKDIAPLKGPGTVEMHLKNLGPYDTGVTLRVRKSIDPRGRGERFWCTLAVATVLCWEGTPVFHQDKSALRFVLYSMALGLIMPWATTAVGIMFGSLPSASSLGLAAILAGWLLWPAMPYAAELERMGAPTAELVRVLTIGSLANAVMYGVVGALLWYALHRRRWAWLPLIGLLAVFWWPGHALVLR